MYAVERCRKIIKNTTTIFNFYDRQFVEFFCLNVCNIIPKLDGVALLVADIPDATLSKSKNHTLGKTL